MTRAAAFALAALASAAGAQYDADAPEPLGKLAGGFVIGGAGELPGEARDWLLQLAGGSGAKLVVLSVEGPVELPPWEEAGFAVPRLVVARTPGEARSGDLAAALAGADAVWLAGGRAARHAEVFAGIRHALLEVHLRGGALGADGDAAATLGAGGLALLPGCTVGDPSRVGDEPELVHLEVARDTALVLRGRSVFAVGRGDARAHLAASATNAARGPRIVSMRGRQVADLIALSRAAVARAGTAFPADAPPAPRVPNGHLLIVGGGELPDTLSRFIELAGGPDAPLVFIPCSSREVIEKEPGTVGRLREAGARNVTWIHTKDRRRSDADPSILGPLREARGIWFGGGRQWNFVDSYANTAAHELMHAVLERGGVIGGSSAGASIQASYLARGDPLGNGNIIAEGYERGLGFLTGVAIDQHFTKRGRHRDMTALKNAFPQLLGIGVDEATELHVHGTVGEVRGVGRVFFYDRERPTRGGEDFTALEAGARYDLVERRVL